MYHQSNAIVFDGVKVGEKVFKYFYIRNLSGISTKASLEIQKFKTHESNSINENCLLFVDPMKRVTNYADRLRLNDNLQGIGFGLEKYEIDLPPFACVECPIILIAEMWGSYKDKLIVNADGLNDSKIVNLNAEIIDLPIRLYTGKVSENETEQIAMIRFGSQVQGKEPITRKLQLLNTSHMQLHVDWQIFLVEKGDDRLIDLNLLSTDKNSHNLLNEKFRKNNDKASNEEQKRGKGSVMSLIREDTSDLSSNSSMLERKIQPANDNQTTLCSNKPSFKSEPSSTSFDYFDMYIQKRIPLINLKMTQHYGQEIEEENSNGIFSINQRKMILKPRDKTTLSITFNTKHSKCQEYEAIFIGYLSLPSQVIFLSI